MQRNIRSISGANDGMSAPDTPRSGFRASARIVSRRNSAVGVSCGRVAHLSSSRSEFENRVVLFLHASSGISAAASPSGASFLVSSLHRDQHDPRDDREKQQMAPPDRIGVVLIANGARSSRISRTGGRLSTVLYWRYSVVPAAKAPCPLSPPNGNRSPSAGRERGPVP